MEILTKKKKDSPEEDISEGFEEEAAGIESLKTPWSCLDVFRSVMALGFELWILGVMIWFWSWFCGVFGGGGGFEG